MPIMGSSNLAANKNTGYDVKNLDLLWKFLLFPLCFRKLSVVDH